MRTNADPDGPDPLLDAVLGDEDWDAVSATLKHRALGTFRARERMRRLVRWAGGVATLIAVIAAVVHWVGPPVTGPRQNRVALSNAAKGSRAPRFLTDNELVAAFPAGSCFIAEVDGKKELVFTDPELERTYVAHPGVRDK